MYGASVFQLPVELEGRLGAGRFICAWFVEERSKWDYSSKPLSAEETVASISGDLSSIHFKSA
ncbi:hypothetical protein Ancab_028609 [Ancistrocladus abbreviatus]